MTPTKKQVSKRELAHRAELVVESFWAEEYVEGLEPLDKANVVTMLRLPNGEQVLQKSPIPELVRLGKFVEAYRVYYPDFLRS